MPFYREFCGVGESIKKINLSNYNLKWFGPFYHLIPRLSSYRFSLILLATAL